MVSTKTKTKTKMKTKAKTKTNSHYYNSKPLNMQHNNRDAPDKSFDEYAGPHRLSSCRTSFSNRFRKLFGRRPESFVQNGAGKYRRARPNAGIHTSSSEQSLTREPAEPRNVVWLGDGW
jgi:hypothetical protein